MNGHYRLWKNLMQKKSKESEEIITMIIDNVKVYTESGEFILGGIITQGDTITAVYTEKEKEVKMCIRDRYVLYTMQKTEKNIYLI